MGTLVNPFANLLKEVQSLPKESEPKLIDANFLNCVEGAFKNTLQHIDEMSESSVVHLINNNIDTISKEIALGDKSYHQYFTNLRFLNIFIRVCNNRPIDRVIRIACNIVIYDYFTSDNPNRKIKERMMDLAEAVNKNEINKLRTKGLSDNVIKNIVIARFSSIDEYICALRVNFVLCNQDPLVMDTNLVVYIYEVLFDHIKDLFLATMFETYSIEDRDNLGDNFIDVYNTVGRAVLTIINNMTRDQIKELLKIYVEEYTARHYPAVRFSLRSLSADYGRIVMFVEALREQNIFVP